MSKTRIAGRNGFVRFLRNNLALIIIVVCLLSIITIVIVASINANKPPLPVDTDPDDTDPTDTDPTDTDPDDTDPIEVFLPPVETYTLGMDYTDDAENLFVFNNTLGWWEAHRAVDFLTEEGAGVTAMKSGTVLSVGSTYGLGGYVKIDHGEGVVATYACLKNICVTAGNQVAQGDKIGEASDSANYEFKDGPHLHLEMTLNGAKVNPWDYIDRGEEEE